MHSLLRSYLAVPVQSRSGDVIGGLFFGHSSPAKFHQNHEELMVGIAAHAAIAPDNARLYDELRRLNDSLEHRVEEAIAERIKAEEAGAENGSHWATD